MFLRISPGTDVHRIDPHANSVSKAVPIKTLGDNQGGLWPHIFLEGPRDIKGAERGYLASAITDFTSAKRRVGYEYLPGIISFKWLGRIAAPTILHEGVGHLWKHDRAFQFPERTGQNGPPLRTPHGSKPLLCIHTT